MNNKYIKNKNGFTLIEVLVVGSMFLVLSFVVLAIFSTSIQTSKKSDQLISIRQNGNNALSKMTREIRYANSLDNPSSCTTSVSSQAITFTSSSNEQITLSCEDVPGMITSNGEPLLDPQSINVSSCAFTCTQKTANDPQNIKFQFSLTVKNDTSSLTVPFQTSVTLRNFPE